MGGIAILRRIFRRRKATPPPVQTAPAPVAAPKAQLAPVATVTKDRQGGRYGGRKTIMTGAQGLDETEANVRQTTLGGATKKSKKKPPSGRMGKMKSY